MSKAAKIILFPLIFIVSFVFFLYWTFPYGVLKDKIIGMVEQQIGGGIEVNIETLEPYWFTGVEVTNLVISDVSNSKEQPLLKCKRAYARASFFSLIIGRPNFSFDIEMDKGEVSGSFAQNDESLSIDAEFDAFDLSSFQLISSRIGINLSSKIDGDISLKIDRTRPLQSTGQIDLTLSDLKVTPSEAKIGELAIPLPDLTLAKGRESKIKIGVSKGAIVFDTLKFAGGDLALDMKGKIFLSPKVENYRFNLTGTFTASKKLSDALPFLFIVEQQKQQDNSYPLALSGRIGKPVIKVGTFTVPL